MRFVALSNYLKLLQDPLFLNALKNTVIWMVLYTCLTTGLGLTIAVLLEGNLWYASLVKSIVFLPMVISYVAGGIIWAFIYDPDFGVLNAFLRFIKLSSLAQPWLGNPKTALYSIIIAGTWMWSGFSMIIISAGLKSIPPQITEAAKIDGANNWQLFWHVTLPLLIPPLMVVVITTGINSLKVFDIVFTMTRGGPFYSSEVIAHFMYMETFYHSKMGYGSAIAVMLFLIVIIASIPYLKQMAKGMSE
jgi:ABC-type sugar transport system permease subunit